jgi:hypothetical protein
MSYLAMYSLQVKIFQACSMRDWPTRPIARLPVMLADYFRFKREMETAVEARFLPPTPSAV